MLQFDVLLSEEASSLSDFGLCATDVREPRQVRKEATVTSLSVCRRSTRSLINYFGF